jgi:hypothetical protein
MSILTNFSNDENNYLKTRVEPIPQRRVHQVHLIYSAANKDFIFQHEGVPRKQVHSLYFLRRENRALRHFTNNEYLVHIFCSGHEDKK